MPAPASYATPALLVLLLGAIAWQTWTLQDLSTRVADLEDSRATSQAIATVSSRRQAAQRSPAPRSPAAEEAIVARVAERLAEQQGEEGVSEATSEQIREVLDEEFDRLADERKDREVGQWVEMASQSVSHDVGKIGEDYDIAEATQQEVVDLIVESLWTGVDIRAAIASGDMTVGEAKEQGEVIDQELKDRIVGLIGEDATDDLFERFDK